MRVLILNQFYAPDISAVSQMATDLAEDFVSKGHEVTVLASQGTYFGEERLTGREQINGVDVIRVSATSWGKRTLGGRLIDYLSFFFAAMVRIGWVPRQDVIVAMTVPPWVAVVGLWGRFIRHGRLVVWVQDLYPDVGVALGTMREKGVLTLLFRWVTRRCLVAADKVVVLGAAMRQRVLALGAATGDVVVLPNWADGEAIQPRAKPPSATRFTVMYSGNMGRGHDIETILDAARRLDGKAEVVFSFVGDGAKRGLVEAAARGATNVELRDYCERGELADSLGAGDVHVVSLLSSLEGMVEPSKLYGVMAAGRPAIFVGPSGSEVASTIRTWDCGLVVENGAAEELVGAIVRLKADDEGRHRMGRNARQALDQEYGREHATSRFAKILESM